MSTAYFDYSDGEENMEYDDYIGGNERVKIDARGKFMTLAEERPLKRTATNNTRAALARPVQSKWRGRAGEGAQRSQGAGPSRSAQLANSETSPAPPAARPAAPAATPGPHPAPQPASQPAAPAPPVALH